MGVKKRQREKVSFGTCLPPATHDSHHPNLRGLGGLGQTTALQKNKHRLLIFIVVMENKQTVGHPDRVLPSLPLLI